ncbi:polysaccharide deacetylase family protein [Streptococcaceae bacterium ESL0687]|nr:polysaccharide deacetylase family protein [Streptococcaceae bacterium ESL0687]
MKIRKLFKYVLLGLAVGLIIGFGYQKFNSSSKSHVQTSDSSQTSSQEGTTSKESSSSQSSDETTSKVSWKKSDTTIKFPILMYHHISEVVDGNTLFVPPAEFEMEMKTLKDAGYYTLSPDEAYRVLTKNEKPADKIVWVTLDDGYVDNMKNAQPVLDKLKMKATIMSIWNMKDGLDKMTDDQLLQINKDPLITIESHTVDHIDLGQASDEEASYQLVESKKGLDKLLNQDTSVICYPSGRYNDDTGILAKDAGYKMGLTTNPGLASIDDGIFTLNRVRVAYGHDSQSFLNLISE